MLAHIASPNRVALTSCAAPAAQAFHGFGFRCLPFTVPSKQRTGRIRGMFASFDFDSAGGAPFPGLSDFRRHSHDCLFRRCKGWDGEGNLELEVELLEFMKNSENPVAFPTKKQLLGAGRKDLVLAILRQGGWLSWGWDMDDDNGEKHVVADGDVSKGRLVIPREIDSSCLGGVEQEVMVESAGTFWDTDASEYMLSSSYPPNSSQGMNPDKDTGIDGILNRLEKQRNASMSLAVQEEGNDSQTPGMPDKDHDIEKGTSSHPKNDEFGENGSFTDYSDQTNVTRPEIWRKWSMQRARDTVMEFEVGEIVFDKSRMGDNMNALKDGISFITECPNEAVNKRKESNLCGEVSNCNQINGRLQQLQLELSSTLNSLRSKSSETISHQDLDRSSDCSERLSDAWEFGQNEVINAQNLLRSIRATLAISEGKMALAVIDSQKTVEEKQKRINDVRKALELLRTVCIVWPNSASEVLLAGSYDGWTTKRKMDRSCAGVFSLWLKLYPGKYEIKFIVDGTWMTDPLRPIFNNNGFENNLFIVT